MIDLSGLIVFPLFLVFCRMGTAMMVFPSLSDPSVNTRFRLLLAAFISLIVWPVVADTLPQLPTDVGRMALLIGGEMIMGFLMAVAARLFMSALSVAGEMISFATGLQAATLFDPVNNSNTTAVTLFLLLVAGLLVILTNLHHVLIQGIVQSYQYFPPGKMPLSGDVLQAVISLIEHMFIVGLKIAAPIVVVGFLSYVAFGIFNRLIPQLHVFFVALPVSIMVGMFIMSMVLTGMLTLFVTELHNNAILFTQQG